MTLNTSQVSYYMAQRKKGVTQHILAMKAGISVRSGRQLEKDQWSKAGARHWRTRKDPLEAVWDSMLVPLLKERPALMPTTLLEMLQDKYPGQYPNILRRTMQRRVREWKLQYGAEQEVMFRQQHKPSLRGLSDFTELKGVVVTIAGKSTVWRKSPAHSVMPHCEMTSCRTMNGGGSGVTCVTIWSPTWQAGCGARPKTCGRI